VLRAVPLLALALVLAGPVTGDEGPQTAPPPPVPVDEDPAAASLLDDPFLDDPLLDDDALQAELLQQEPEVHDPFETFNRGIFGLNQFFDTILFDPLARTYNFLVPGPGRRAVRRFFDNLGTPPILMNDLLQRRGRRAGVTSARFVINTTVGVAGLFDPAKAWGLERHDSDFGQTLYTYGVGSGPYLMLPLFGPATARDGFGLAVDMAMRPDTWLLGGAFFLVGAGEGLSLRAENVDELEELERSSIDFYAALKSVYWMHRQTVLRAALDEEAPASPTPAPTPPEPQADASPLR
jgi:phospholipid-binding lipoprotein MlaA